MIRLDNTHSPTENAEIYSIHTPTKIREILNLTGICFKHNLVHAVKAF